MPADLVRGEGCLNVEDFLRGIPGESRMVHAGFVITHEEVAYRWIETELLDLG
ncbi:MAG: hypothetical protein ACOX51_08880 [Myxococcota bacterium]